MFLEITRRTGQHNMIQIVTGRPFRATQGNRVLKVEDVLSVLLLKFRMAARGIVAAIALCFQFLLDLLFGKRSWRCEFSRSPLAVGSDMCSFPRRRFRILLLIDSNLLLVRLAVLYDSVKRALSMLLVILLLIGALLVCMLLLISLLVGKLRLSMRLVIPLLIGLHLVCMLGLVAFFVRGDVLLMRLLIPLATVLAFRTQSIRSACPPAKEHRGSRK